MGLLTLEHSKTAYGADYALYAGAILVLAASLLWAGPRDARLAMMLLVLAGFAGWSLIEYLLHRFLLHKVQPFCRWHAEHHDRPTALICAPTVVSALSIVVLCFIPALLLGGVWPALALTLGLITGYLFYAVTHHATHHWRGENAWLKRRKRMHALHHHESGAASGHFGVTSAFWDYVFGTD